MKGRLHPITPYLDDTAGTLAAELALETEAHLSKQAAFDAYLLRSQHRRDKLARVKPTSEANA